MGLSDKMEIPRRVMTLFFIVDTSGSMEGDKMGTVNTAIREVIPEIRDLSAKQADSFIKVATLEFSSGARWITSTPVDSDQFNWSNLEGAGTTDFGAMCRALNEKLSTKAFMAEATGSFAPALFILSDGQPTDDWKSGLDILRQNNWFKAAVKVAIAIGDDADMNVLTEFTGNKETVIKVHTPEMLAKMIKFVSVRASQVASQSAAAVDPSQSGGDDGGKNDVLGQQIQIFTQENPDSGEDVWC